MTIKSTDFEAELAYAENGNYKRQAEFSPVTKSAPAQQSKYADFRNQLTFLTKSIKKAAPDQGMMPQMGNDAMPGLPAMGEGGDMEALLAELGGGADATPAAPIATPEMSDADPSAVAGKDNEAIQGEELIEQLKALLQDPNASEEEIEQLIQQIVQSGVMTEDEVMALVDELMNEETETTDEEKEADDEKPMPASGVKKSAPSGEDNSPIPDFDSL